ncbi:MAG: hypothetical protein J0H35_14105 [Rhodospirillales bacterium]|nr:hypothetical protein [Rhodospirillales bacterium]
MLTRRILLAGSAGALSAPAILRPALAATPKNAVVMVKQIDDIISFDPAESYEFSNSPSPPKTSPSPSSAWCC